MQDRRDVLPWWLPLLGLVPAVAIAQLWPASELAALPFAVLPLYAGYKLWLPLARRPERAFAVALGQLFVVWTAAFGSDSLNTAVWLIAAGLLFAALALMSSRLPRRACQDLAQGVLALALVLPIYAVLRAQDRDAGPVVGQAVEVEPQRPLMFIPLELDPTGRRLALLSLQDLDSDDDEALSLWSLDIPSGQPTRAFQGFPFLLADWCPAGNNLVFMASSKPWLEDDGVPFGIFRAAAAGGSHRVVLPVPEDGSSWLYPQWSKVGDLVAAWRTSESAAESWVRSASGSGEARKIEVPGCRLALFGAWQADAAGCFAITERGLFLLPAEGKPQRLVPSGEAPLDPFPLVVPDGVSPSGQHLAYLELLFKRGEIDRIDVGVKRLGGRQQSVMRNIHQLALAWSADGKYLATGTLARQNELVLQLLDVAAGKKVAFKTGLHLAGRQYPIRFKWSPSGRYLAMDGQFKSEEGWDVAVVDLESRKATVLDRASEHLLCGWTPDQKMVVSNLGTVATIQPDGSGYTPVYGQGHGSVDMLLAAVKSQSLDLERRLATAMEAVMSTR